MQDDLSICLPIRLKELEYILRIVFKFPRVIKVHNFIISLSMMYAGLLMLITTISLNKAWNFVLICTVICQVLYSGISIYALYYIFKIRRLNNFRIERSIIGSNQRTNNIEQSSIAYSPELQDRDVYKRQDHT